MSESIDNEWYTTNEAEKITGYKYKSFSTAIKRGKLHNYKWDKNILLLHKDVIAEYLEKRKLESYMPVFGEIGNQDWFSVKQAQIITGICFQAFSKAIRNGEITNFKTISGCRYIHRDVVTKYLEEKNMVMNNYLTEDEAANLLGITIGAIKAIKFNGTIIYQERKYYRKSEVENLKNKREGRMQVHEVVDYLGLRRNYIEDLMARGILESYQVNGYLRYILRDSVLDFELLIKTCFNYCLLASTTGITEEELRKLSKIGIFKVYPSLKHGEIILKEDADQVIEFLDKYFILSQIESIYGIRPAVVKKNMIFSKSVEYEVLKNVYAIQKESFINFYQTDKGIRIKYYGTEKYQDFLNELMTLYMVNSPVKETLGYYHEWVKRRLHDSNIKRKKQEAGNYLATAEHLNMTLTKELHLYTDDEITKLLQSPILTANDKENLGIFLNSLSKQIECKFSSGFSTAAKRDRKKAIGDVLYSKYEWVAICGRLCDISAHIDAAISKRRYAETWLYLLLHMALAWRAADFKKINNIPIELAQVNELEWFKENTLTPEKAQILINEMFRRGIGIKTDKTRVNTHLVIALLIPTATALIIAELHNRKDHKNNRGLLSAKGYRAYDFKKVLGEKLPGFGNRKVNSSLLTYGFETAVRSGERSEVAYALSTYARSHSEKVGVYNDTTKKYLHLLGTDVNVSDIAKHLFERGFFGWQMNLMLEMIVSTDLWSLTEKTEAISEFRTKMTAMSTENLSKYVHTRYAQYNDLVIELIKLSKEDIMAKLIEIAEYKSPALIEFSQCIKGIGKCLYNDKQHCLGCKYHIPTNYILEIVNTNLYSIIAKLEECELSDILLRAKLSHLIDKLLFIITDFRIAYKNFDENYFKSFINYDELISKLEKLESTKMISLEE